MRYHVSFKCIGRRVPQTIFFYSLSSFAKSASIMIDCFPLSTTNCVLLEVIQNSIANSKLEHRNLSMNRNLISKKVFSKHLLSCSVWCLCQRDPENLLTPLYFFILVFKNLIKIISCNSLSLTSVPSLGTWEKKRKRLEPVAAHLFQNFTQEAPETRNLAQRTWDSDALTAMGTHPPCAMSPRSWMAMGTRRPSLS